MRLTIYDIIIKPVMTEKASKLLNQQKQVKFQVHPHANKTLIKEAIKKLFDVEAVSVNIIVRKGKIRTFKRIKSQGKLKKFAIITLKDDKSFDKLVYSGTGMTPEAGATSVSGS